jgi:mRNA interferase MazF
MKRGEIYFANLDPTIGSEIKKKRPVLIISNNANNRAATTITVVPLTSKTEKIYSFEVFLDMKESKLQKPSKALCQQIRSLSKERIIGRKIGELNIALMNKINAALCLHLDLGDK